MVSRVGAGWWRAVRVLAVACVLVVLLSVLLVAGVIGADPSPLPGELLAGGDPRSEGSGPGLVGSPVVVLLGVVALGVLTAAVTALVARLAQRR